MTAATDALAAATSAVTAEVDSLTGMNAALNAANASLSSTNSALLAENAALKAQIANPPTTGNPALPAGWTKELWSDYFPGTAVDTTKWNVRNDNGQGNNQATNLASNVVVANGYLSIKGGTNPAGSAKPYNAGYIDTNGKAFNQVSGLFEIRARFPWGSTAAGIWDALWMRDNGGGGGEIDIMEDWPAKNALHATVFGDTNTGTPKVSGAQPAIPPFDPTQWHTYAVQKEPGILRFLYDNVVLWDAYAGASAATVAWLDSAITRSPHPWAFRICRQIGGSYGGAPTPSTNLSQTLDIDYVRILGH